MTIRNRRAFLRALASTAAATAGVTASATLIPDSIRKALAVSPRRVTGSLQDVEHVAIFMQENRSFDHYFGTLRGVRGFGDKPQPRAAHSGICSRRRMPERTRKTKPPAARKSAASSRPRAVEARGTAARERSAHSHVASKRPLTPLARTLKEKPEKRATPLDAFMLARAKWERGERLDIGQIAAELGVGRATLFRWVGSRERLYGELFTQAYTRLRARLMRDIVGRGPELVAELSRRTLKTLFAAPAMRTFIEQDPEYAIRILTSKSSPVQERCIEIEANMLRELAARGEIEPAIDIDTLAYLLVRIGESFLYGDVISGRDPDLDAAATAVRILVAAKPPAKIRKK